MISWMMTQRRRSWIWYQIHTRRSHLWRITNTWGYGVKHLEGVIQIGIPVEPDPQSEVIYAIIPLNALKQHLKIKLYPVNMAVLYRDSVEALAHCLSNLTYLDLSDLALDEEENAFNGLSELSKLQTLVLSHLPKYTASRLKTLEQMGDTMTHLKFTDHVEVGGKLEWKGGEAGPTMPAAMRNLTTPSELDVALLHYILQAAPSLEGCQGYRC